MIPPYSIWQRNEPWPYGSEVHYAIQRARKEGHLQSQPCIICGAKGHAHHPDYSKPFDVVFLCHVYHMKFHRRLRRRFVEKPVQPKYTTIS
jgi:hypothetical protein